MQQQESQDAQQLGGRYAEASKYPSESRQPFQIKLGAVNVSPQLPREGV